MLMGSVGPPEGPGAHVSGAIGHHRAVASRAELSSMSSTLDELTRRVGAMAEEAADHGEDELANELFGIERTLGGALRRMRRMAEGPKG